MTAVFGGEEKIRISHLETCDTCTVGSLHVARWRCGLHRCPHAPSHGIAHERSRVCDVRGREQSRAFACRFMHVQTGSTLAAHSVHGACMFRGVVGVRGTILVFLADSAFLHVMFRARG